MEAIPLDIAARRYWVSTLGRIVNPVLSHLANGSLKKKMPVESAGGFHEERAKYAHLEAFGRVVAGISAWLALGGDDTGEGQLRRTYIDLVSQGLAIATEPSSGDFMNFTQGRQPLVDAAFLAQGLLRGYDTLWQPLDHPTKMGVLRALRSTRAIKPAYSNWLLFTAVIEAFFLRAGEEWDPVRIDYAVKKHLEWYEGDGTYGDGPDFRWDYYNSYVIQPMLLDVLRELVDHDIEDPAVYSLAFERAKRYATIQERMVSPDGTFPPIGRSLAYRCGAFHLLSQLALMDELPDDVPPPQARSVLTAVIYRMMEAPGTFDADGWLTIGFYGHQPSIGETYISTGSLYLCTTAFLPLGLAADNPFWTLPPADWTQKRIWSGEDVKPDRAHSE